MNWIAGIATVCFRGHAVRGIARSTQKPQLKTLALLLMASLVLCAGCTDKVEPITSYKVKKHKLIQIPLDEPTDSATPPAPAGPMTIEDPTDRILGAIVLLDDAGWFVKGAAPVDAWPEDAEEQFDKLLTTFKFEKPDKPTWELSDRWKENPPSTSMRVADLALGDVTFSVTPLPKKTANDRKYLLDNVIRWRRQLSLGGVDSTQLANTSHKIKTADGKSATVVNLLGKKDSSSMPPMMRGGQMGSGPQSGGPMAGPKPQAASGPGFTGEPPEAWEETKTRMFQKARYIVTSGEETGYASVSQARGDVMMNVNRWRDQVGLPSIESPEEVAAEPVSVGGVDGLLLRLIGENEGIVIAMVPDMKSRDSWFFKLDGSKELVESEADSFLKYLDTIQFE